MKVGLAAALLLVSCTEPIPRDATAEEMTLAAAKCGVRLIDFGPNVPRERTGELSSKELGLPGVHMILEFQTDEEFIEKGTCLLGEMKAIGAQSYIWGPNGEDLLF